MVYIHPQKKKTSNRRKVTSSREMAAGAHRGGMQNVYVGESRKKKRRLGGVLNAVNVNACVRGKSEKASPSSQAQRTTRKKPKRSLFVGQLVMNFGQPEQVDSEGTLLRSLEKKDGTDPDLDVSKK